MALTIASARPCGPTLERRTRAGAVVHGSKEGINGSSPLEGSAKAPHVGAFCVQVDLRGSPRAVGMEPFMSMRVDDVFRAATEGRFYA
jgi:hypothetical protein